MASKLIYFHESFQKTSQKPTQKDLIKNSNKFNQIMKKEYLGEILRPSKKRGNTQSTLSEAEEPSSSSPKINFLDL